MTRPMPPRLPSLPARDIEQLKQGRHPDPFAILGRHRHDEIDLVRTFLPGANYVELIVDEGGQRRALPMVGQGDGLFEAALPQGAPYRIRAAWPGGITETADPYSFGLLLSDDDLYLAAEGRHFDLATRLGANLREIDGVAGVLFAVWAPNAAHVAVVGDFNGWNATRHPMRRRLGAGIWELFIPGVEAGAVYKYALISARARRCPGRRIRSPGAPNCLRAPAPSSPKHRPSPGPIPTG